MAKGSQRSSAIFAVILVFVLIAAGIWLWRNRAPVSGEQMVLTPTSFAALPGWNGSNARTALAAFRRSCGTFSNQSPMHSLGGAGYAGAVADWDGACAAAPGGTVSEGAARRYFEAWFVPVAVSSAARSDALLTGYYEPEIHGSLTRHGAYTTPVYGEPDDLLTADLGSFKDSLKGERVTGRVVGHAFVPYPNRAEIDTNGLPHAAVLLYADDPVQVFFLHIQGSGRVRLDDGAFERVAYAGQNGRPYTAVGRVLIQRGAIDRSQMSMQAIRSWLQAHPDAARGLMESDQSFVFFRVTPLGDPALGSPGSEGVPLTPEASVAIDEHLHALGVPFFISAMVPDANPSKPDRTLNRMFVAQDTGGAIKGPARADVFWGFGRAAESIAGRMKSTGRMFVLLPKALAARIAPHTEYSAP